MYWQKCHNHPHRLSIENVTNQNIAGRDYQDGLGAAGGQPRQQVPRGEDPEAEAPGAGGARHQGQLRVEGEGEELLRVRLREQGLCSRQLIPPVLLLGLQPDVNTDQDCSRESPVEKTPAFIC